MYIERIEGDWTDHPFWASGFLITKPSDLKKLHESSVSAVIVDDSRSVAASKAGAAVKATALRSRTAAIGPTPEQARFIQTSQACRRAVRDIFVSAQSGGSVDAERSGMVVDMIARSLEENPAALISLTRLKTMETYTFTHSVSVAALLVRFGRHLALDEAEIQEIGMAGLLHDIGKVRIDDAILTKTSSLTEDEIALIRSHPVFGIEILSKSADLSPTVLDICRHHHERIDGTGYPDRLSDGEVSFHARIAAICDVFDALTTARPYKLAWSTDRALSSMATWTGHFDPELLRQFALSMGRAKLSDSFGLAGAGPVADGTAINGYSDPSA